ncbi:hypothetical protein EZS27_010289 [termite gut metagenome]|uniref:DUF4248 domain-containing protein n=1 Tax=termite gut metagenome TaxID=433724 RepID=A0A5J4S9N4_9ZZZZ
MEKMETTDNFRIQAYSKGKLASKYFSDKQPKMAGRLFKKCVDESPGLMERLIATGFKPSNRIYTPAQVRLIVEALGEP